MRPQVTLRKALSDKQLLGNALPGDTWSAWRTMLIAAMGEPLTDEERITFTKLTGREREPLRRIEEAAFIVGRRGGKSRGMAVLACYISALCEHRLVAGERGICLCIAPDQRQAKIALDFATATLEGSPILKQLIANRTADTLELTNRITIEIRASSWRRLRGPTFIAVLADEAAFWYSDEFSANADTEILNACRPGLATTAGPLLIASSPYAKRGELWQTYRKHYGPDGDPLVLVAKGSSREFNPSLPQSVVDRALERDQAAASAEYLAQFRSDIESFISLETVERCVADYVERAPLPQHHYFAFTDPSGGSADSFTLAISHKEGERVIVDAVREVKPPFSPEATINDFSILLKSYNIKRVTDDKYAGEFPCELFRRRGVTYWTSEKSKSDLYRDMLPALNSGRLVLPRNERLISQLTGLERRTTRAGRDSIDHSPGGHDDIANAVAGAYDVVAEERARFPRAILRNWDGSSYLDDDDRIDSREWKRVAGDMEKYGIPPSTIAKDSDIPSDETMRRNGFYSR
jgi:hypothetical protein